MNITKVRKVKTPVRGTEGSAGLDFFVPQDQKAWTIPPGRGLNIPSGIHAKIPRGFAMIAMNKSGVSLKKGLQVGACVIDEDYQGEIHLHVRNISNIPVEVVPGEKLMQMLIIPVMYADVEVVPSVEALYKDQVSERGAGGFGSTGNS